MKYTLKKLLPGIIISIVVFVMCLFGFIALNGTLDYNESELKVAKHQMVVDVEDDGDIYIKEDVTLDLETYWNYVIKDIGFRKDERVEDDLGFEIDNAQSYFDEGSFKANIYDEDGRPIDYELERDYYFNQDEIRSFKMTSKGNFVSGVKIHYEYRICNAVTVYNDVAELNWILVDDWDYDTDDIDITINLPSDDITFYGHGVTSDNPVNINGSSISFHIDKLRRDELIEVRILFDEATMVNVNYNKTIKHNALEKITSIEQEMQNRGEMIKKAHETALTIELIALAILLAFAIYKTVYCYKKFDKERVSLFDSEYYRELPADYSPAELGMLLNFNELGKNELEATLLDLIRRKYIELDMNGCSTIDKKPNYKLIRTTQNGYDLKQHERKLLSWFFDTIAKGNELTLDQLDAYLKKEKNARKYLEDSKSFAKSVYEESKVHNFFDDVKDVKKHSIGIIIASVIGCLISLICVGAFEFYPGVLFMGLFAIIAILFSFYVNFIKRRSEKGNEDYVRWIAFKNFLEEFSTFEDYPMPAIIVWEKYLVYASEFGIAQKVEEQMNLKFKNMDMNPIDYIEDSSSCYLRYRFSCYYFHRRISSTYYTAQSTIAQAQSSNGSKGGFGGGRSFGGGGGGMRGGR